MLIFALFLISVQANQEFLSAKFENFLELTQDSDENKADEYVEESEIIPFE